MGLLKKILSYFFILCAFLSLLCVFVLSDNTFGFLFFIFFTVLFGFLGFKLNPITKSDIECWRSDFLKEFYNLKSSFKKFFSIIKYEFKASKEAAERRRLQEAAISFGSNRTNTPEYEITYEDIDGNYSSRSIDIERVYKKSGRIYVDAYCYLMAETRTFRADRIITMKYCSNSEDIYDIKSFFKTMLY